MMTRENIQSYFQRAAPVWEFWHTKNKFYHDKIGELINGMVPPGAKVLEVGSGTGGLLASLNPSCGIGLNLADELTDQARRNFPQ